MPTPRPARPLAPPVTRTPDQEDASFAEQEEFYRPLTLPETVAPKSTRPKKRS